MQNHPRIVIAGTKGGSGKTTVTLALIAALSAGNLRVTPFKKGPDYIDAGWMSLAAQSPCYNLDAFLISVENIVASFAGHFTGDIAVVEGNRGLHDGMDAEGSSSTGELAKLLAAPVILVVDCTKMTRSAAAVVLGFASLDAAVPLRGVVLNQVAGSRHESLVRASIERYCSLPVLGAVPRMEAAALPERHLGLTPMQEYPDRLRAMDFSREVGGKYLDLKKILAIARDVAPLRPAMPRQGEGADLPDGQGDPVAESCRAPRITVTPHLRAEELPSVRIGVIKDSAFQFYYPENLEELRGLGAEIVEISALAEPGLPDIDALYIGGGFPETHAIALAANSLFRESLKHAVEEGLPVYAECGGLMYLGRSLLLGGREYPMAGVFPLRFCLEAKPQAHGYSIVEVSAGNPFYEEGVVLKGHEFHYSRPLDRVEDQGYTFAFTMKRGQGLQDKSDGICFRNVLATYTHLHALGTPEWSAGLMRRAVEHRRRKNATDRESGS